MNASTAVALVKERLGIKTDVRDIYLTTALGVVTVTASDPGEVTVTAVSPDATITVATLRAIGYVECDTAFLDEGFTHLALRVTNSAATLTGAILVRGENRYSPLTNQVAAAKVDVKP